MKEATAVDAAEDEKFGDARGDELPAKWRGRQGRKERIKAALADLQERQAPASGVLTPEQQVQAAKYESLMADTSPGSNTRRLCVGMAPAGVDQVKMAELALERARADGKGRMVRYQARKKQAEAQGTKVRGQEPVAVEQRAHVRRAKAKLDAAIARATKVTPAPDRAAKLRANITDLDSRIMKTRRGWIQGFNAQLAVSDYQIIIAARVTQDGNDAKQFIPVMNAAVFNAQIVAANRAEPNQNGIGVIVADAGYFSESNLSAPGPQRLIALAKQHATETAAKTNPAHGAPPPGLSAIQAMNHQLRTELGAAAYARRKVLVEPVNGHIKD